MSGEQCERAQAWVDMGSSEFEEAVFLLREAAVPVDSGLPLTEIVIESVRAALGDVDATNAYRSVATRWMLASFQHAFEQTTRVHVLLDPSPADWAVLDGTLRLVERDGWLSGDLDVGMGALCAELVASGVPDYARRLLSRALNEGAFRFGFYARLALLMCQRCHSGSLTECSELVTDVDDFASASDLLS